MNLSAITVNDVLLFVMGIIVGTLAGWGLGKIVFSRLFKKQEKAITLENSAKFQAVQQGLNYLFGFALRTAVISLQISVLLLVFWLGVQTFLAVKVFGFDSPIQGVTFAFIDTLNDLVFGALFGTGTATFTLFRLALTLL